MKCLLFQGIICLTITNAINFVNRNATRTDATGDYYIASQFTDDGTEYFKYDTLTCSTGPNCYIICDMDSSCSSAKLYALDNVENIYLNCSAQQSCSSFDIYPSTNLKNIEMNCPESSSCSGIIIASSPSDSFKMTCTGPRACSGAQYNLSYTTDIDIYCDWTYTTPSTSSPPCGGSIHMEYATNVNIICGTASCYFLDMYLNYTTSANIIGTGKLALQYSEIYAINMPSSNNGLNVTCLRYGFGGNSVEEGAPCSDTKIYCPINNGKCTLNCPDRSSCYNTYVIVENRMYNGLTLNCNHATDIIWNNKPISTSCSDMTIVCNDTIKSAASPSVHSAQYETTITWNETVPSEWFCGTWDIYGPYSCCPLPIEPVIDCGGITSDCTIDCSSTDCLNKIIDGSSATSSLLVNCDKIGGNGCKGSKVKCPLSDSSTCNFNCNEPYACKSIAIEISANQLSSVNMECGSNYSCSEISIIFSTVQNNNMPLMSVSNINLNCNGYRSCKDNVFYFQPNRIEFINSFVINCIGDESCIYNLIDLWLVNGIDTLNITCGGRYACGDEPDSILKSELIITNQFNTNINKQFNLICSGYYSCYQSKIDILSSEISNILCLEDSSCLTTSTYSYPFIINNIGINGIVNIECNTNSITTQTNMTGACIKRRFSLNYMQSARNIPNVYIKCADESDCFISEFELDWSGNVQMDCIGINSCKKMKVTAPNVEILSINCDNNMYSCQQSMIECPGLNDNSCSISCDNGNNLCDNMEIKVITGYKYNSYLDLNCGLSEGSCDNITFICTKLSYDFPSKLDVIYQWNSISNEYECNSNTPNDCCPWYDNTQIDEINCNLYNGQICNINCLTMSNDGDCNNAIIDGSVASKLIINCNSENLCVNSTLICPNIGDCEIICSANNSCAGLIINFYGTFSDMSTVSLKCIYPKSCTHTNINAPTAYEILLECTTNCEYVSIASQYATNINILCTGSDSYISLFEGCNYNIIYAQYANEFNLYCSANHGCYSNKYYVDYANIVNIKARGSYALRSSNLYASNANNVNIYCAGKIKTGSVCDGYWYYNELVTSINCYGYGCADMGRHYINDKISNINLLWNGCDVCTSLTRGFSQSDCFGSSSAMWTIDCDTSSTNGEWEGTSCYPSDCDCNTLSNKMKEINGFIIDINDPLCLVSKDNKYPGPTPQPTNIPTIYTNNPTISPIPTTANPTQSPITKSPTQITQSPTTKNPTPAPSQNPTHEPSETIVVTDTNIGYSLFSINIKPILFLVIVLLYVM